MRIEVPLELPPPHFDDEATIATARKVVPIGGARAIERQRKLLAMLPILLAATLCGALGAMAVNYFDRRDNAAAPAARQSDQVNAGQTKTEEPQVVIAASSESTAKDSQSEPASVQPQDDSRPTSGQEPAKTDRTNIGTNTDDVPKKSSAKPSAQPDPAKLVRKRRVQPADPEVPAKKNGAGRIEGIFGGPNP